MNRLLSRLRRWLSDHEPIFCRRCQYLMFRKNAKWAQLTSGAVVPICDDCYQEIYHPFEGKK